MRVTVAKRLPIWLARAILIASAAWFGAPSRGAEPQTPAAPIDFVRDIRPLFERHCFDCHGPASQEGGFKLNLRAAALAGGDTGEKAIVPDKPDESRLMKLVGGQDPKLLMPPKDEGEPLSAEQIDLLRRWIAAGAAWPDGVDVPDQAPLHWAWKKPVQAPLPKVGRSDWPRNPIDYFVLARLEQEKLSPAPEADRFTLIRRLSLDLIGLPPSPKEVEDFVNDPRGDAYERLVDRLLDDPGYGERWARMWLDLARYADSKGYGSDPLRTIWRYRDWVIEAFNRNLPYDQFTIEQLAGDLLPNPTADQLLATAFHRNTMANDEGGTDDEEFRVAAVKDRIETTLQVWMGLTAGCAKCHSHKYDPLTQREYYQFYAFFNQTEDADRPDESPRLPTPLPAQLAETQRLNAAIAAVRQQLDQPTPELEASQAKWEQSIAAQAAQWTVLPIEAAASTGGATLEKLPDGSLLAKDANPETDTYNLTVSTDLKGITAFRLEALPHESLPNQGPGRAGNFVLSELKASAADRASKPASGRFVRIEIPGEQKILSLAEVQVFRGADNLALAGKASQSSTDYGGEAKLAIDANTGGDFFEQKSVTHTKSEANPWWEVDLGAMQAVERIVIFNRTDGDTESRLNHFRVALLDEARQPVWQTDVADAPNPSLALTLGGPKPIALAQATADFEQTDFPVAKAIDGDAAGKTGWAVGPQTGQPHEAVFATAAPVGFEGGTILSFQLVQGYGAQHTLGRLRLSATTASPPPRALPGNVQKILTVAASERTAEQKAELARFYRSIAPELQPLRDQIAQLDGQLKALEKQIPTTPVLRELAANQRRVTHVMLKGNYLAPGDIVQPVLPAAFHPLPSGATTDRLGVARWLVDRENPLSGRVAVNRFWAQLFGRGLVETEEDFGTQGAAPTHPELLDWMAVEFAKTWDVKALLKLIVNSATYRQSSLASPDLMQKDYFNRLLARGPRVRLEAEMVRDQALAISGLLSRKQGGPSVFPPQPDGLWRAAFNGERTWATSQGEDRYRRGLYTFWRRTVPYPSMATFDAPSREICSIRRISTNTPLQAFVTLNDPAFVECAQALARRIILEGGRTPETRAAYGLRLCLARPAQGKQITDVVALYNSELAHYQKDLAAAQKLAAEPLGKLPEGIDPAEAAAWTVVSNVLLNLDGVLTKR